MLRDRIRQCTDLPGHPLLELDFTLRGDAIEIASPVPALGCARTAIEQNDWYGFQGRIRQPLRVR